MYHNYSDKRDYPLGNLFCASRIPAVLDHHAALTLITRRSAKKSLDKSTTLYYTILQKGGQNMKMINSEIGKMNFAWKEEWEEK